MKVFGLKDLDLDLDLEPEIVCVQATKRRLHSNKVYNKLNLKSCSYMSSRLAAAEIIKRRLGFSMCTDAKKTDFEYKGAKMCI